MDVFSLQKVALNERENKSHTPPKFNIAPEKWWLEDDPFLLGAR